jgi:hypothetical protein
MVDEIDICDWCLIVFPAEHALFDMLPDNDVHRLIVAACSPQHMLALRGQADHPASEPLTD